MIQNKFIFLIYFLCSFILALNLGFSTNLSHYEYVSSIDISCDEYKGYVKFEVPDEYLSFDKINSYMSEPHFVQVDRSGNFIKHSNWYVNSIDGVDVLDVEKIFDNNLKSSLVLESGNLIKFKFNNPNVLSVNKIQIDVKDSTINSVKVLDDFGTMIDFTLLVDGFRYILSFDESIEVSNLNFVLEYSDVLKLSEVTFFNLEEIKEITFVYFYVDNLCSKTYNFYFGEFGKNSAKSGIKYLPVIFDTNVVTLEHNLYESDFDFDGILNKLDNCLYVSNENQKDINYNRVGDDCEDDDYDRILNKLDNCIDVSNYDQIDSDLDGIGNVCDLEDGRFLEKNNYLVYIFAGVIALAFIGLSYLMIRKK